MGKALRQKHLRKEEHHNIICEVRQVRLLLISLFWAQTSFFKQKTFYNYNAGFLNCLGRLEPSG